MEDVCDGREFSFPAQEESILKLWDSIQAFKTQLKRTESYPEYIFYDGPPFPNAKPHYGHILAGTIKDIITRYHSMNGRHVTRRFGWDCHGLPIEQKIDEKLGIKLGKDMNKIGIVKYNEECKAKALYFCVPFRDQLLEYYSNNKNPGDPEENLLTCLADLFTQISSQKKKTGVIPPRRFVQRVKKQNELFRSYMHQDAHEFLNFLLNELVDILEKESNAVKVSPETSSPSEKIANGPLPKANGIRKEPSVTWVHKSFQGILTNETRCLRCETVTARDETFFDLSLDIEQNSSITSCLKNFSSTETLNAEDKFFCDKCCSLQEAQKRMKIKKPPNILVIHLKRFKYIEQLGRYKKLSYRVVFPLELKLSNTVNNSESEYSLFAVVVHVGSGPNHGHYVSLVKSHNHWLLFDDENVEMMEESAIQTFFGSSHEYSSNTDHGYILFYECVGGKS